MSDYIPFEIQIEIIKNLPIKSLVRFRTVSKPWKSLIDSSKFNADYTGRHAQRQHLFIMYEGMLNDKQEYVSIIDDDTFPEQKSSLNVPGSINLLHDLRIVGSTHGLLCLQGCYQNPGDLTFYYRAVVWNPSIRKSIVVDVPGNIHPDYTFLAFGVCPKTSEPKIFKIRRPRNKRGSPDISWQVKVYTLSSGVWRTSFGNLPSKRIDHINHIDAVVIDGIIYWLALGGKGYILIMSFNFESEEFKEIYIPDKLAYTTSYGTYDDFVIFKLRGSLALVDSKIMDHKQIYEVWIMEDGESKSFTKIYTIELPFDGLRRLLGFRKNDQLIMGTQVGITDPFVISVYEPCSQHINDLGIYGGWRAIFSMAYYMESLLLLDY